MGDRKSGIVWDKNGDAKEWRSETRHDDGCVTTEVREVQTGLFGQLEPGDLKSRDTWSPND